MLPPVVIVIPLYLIFSKIGLLDTYVGMVLPYLIFHVPFAILMLIGFFSDISPSLQEAAMVDGCTEMQALRKVILTADAPRHRRGAAVLLCVCLE